MRQSAIVEGAQHHEYRNMNRTMMHDHPSRKEARFMFPISEKN